MNETEQLSIVQGIENAPEAARLRERVFLEEQGFSTEFDEIDPSAWHLTLFRQGRALAVGRLYPDPSRPGLFIIGRIAADRACRGQGLGRKAVLALEDQARRLGGREIDLSAQCHAQGFYEKLGYTAYGEIYMDEHCPHIHMKKTL